MASNLANVNLTIPAVLWGGKGRAPTHRVSVIAALPDGATVVTATREGQICVWRNDDGKILYPKYLLFGAEEAILCLAPAGTDATSTRFISSSETGKICLWESVDGRCVDNTAGSNVHTSITPHVRAIVASGGQSLQMPFDVQPLRMNGAGVTQTRLFCIGNYSEIMVMDPQDLQILFTLSSRVEPDWMTGICLVKPPQRSDIVIAISMGGMVKIWAVTDVEKRNASNPVFEDESKQISCKNVLSFSTCAQNQRTMLVVSNRCWHVFDASDFAELITFDAPPNRQCAGGRFIKIDKVAIWCTDGSTYLFQLPRSAIFGAKPTNIAPVDQPFCYCVLKTQFPCSVPCFFAGTTDGQQRLIIYRGDHNGNVSVWVTPDVPDRSISALQQENFATYPEAEPTYWSSIQKCWSQLKHSPKGIIDHLEGNVSVTATLYVASQGRLMLGRYDGSILIVYAIHAVIRQLFHGTASHATNKDDWPVVRRLGCDSGGDAAAITCMLYPYEEHPRYDANLLLSGGQDFAVNVWDLNTGTRLHRFCVQAGPITKLIVPPENCNSRILQTVCSIAADHSVALLGLKEQKCVLLASRHVFPIRDIRWRPLDDFLLVHTVDGTVYVWQMETANLDRIVSGVLAEEVLEACAEQTGLHDGGDDAAVVGASSAVQIFRAIRHKNVAAMKKIAGAEGASGEGGRDDDGLLFPRLDPPLGIQPIKTVSGDADSHLLLFNIDALILNLLAEEHANSILTTASSGSDEGRRTSDSANTSPSLSGLLSRAKDKAEAALQISPSLQRRSQSPSSSQQTLQSGSGSRKPSQQIVAGSDASLCMDTAQLLLSMLHGWACDKDQDNVATKMLGLCKPTEPISFGLVSRQGHLTLVLPTALEPLTADVTSTDPFQYFARSLHWQLSSSLTTHHLLAVISVANTLMSMQNASFLPDFDKRRKLLRRLSQVNRPLLDQQQQSSLEVAKTEQAQIKQGWSFLAALHCILLPDLVDKNTYQAPRIELLARRWQDRCLEIRQASQSLLVRELNRMGAKGRKALIESWSPFLPTLLDNSVSILATQAPATVPWNIPGNIPNSISVDGDRSYYDLANYATGSPRSVTRQLSSDVPLKAPNHLSVKPPPSLSRENSNQSISRLDLIAPSATGKATTTTRKLDASQLRERYKRAKQEQEAMLSRRRAADPVTGAKKEGGLQQLRRNQATAVVLMGVIGAEFGQEIAQWSATADTVGMAAPDGFSAGDQSLARATSQSLLELLVEPPSALLPPFSPLRRAAIDLLGRGIGVWQPYLDFSKVLLGLLQLCASADKTTISQSSTLPLSPQADACRTARHALSLIATSRPAAFITALSKEVARYNQAAQHQTLQHSVVSPLIKSKVEILKIIELLCEKHYGDVADLMAAVGEILVHCLDTSLLKHKNIADVFPPISKFYMVSYCPNTRRIVFGAKSGSIVLHDLRAGKAQTIQAHGKAITACAFSEDEKHLATYSADEGKVNFWQTSQAFLGMGASQVKLAKQVPAPSTFPVSTPGGTPTIFRARLLWISGKALTLMLPNGKEHRFSM